MSQVRSLPGSSGLGPAGPIPHTDERRQLALASGPPGPGSPPLRPAPCMELTYAPSSVETAVLSCFHNPFQSLPQQAVRPRLAPLEGSPEDGETQKSSQPSLMDKHTDQITPIV